MYSRSYPQRQEIPESYGGTALREQEYIPECRDGEYNECSTVSNGECQREGPLSSFSGIFEGFGLHLPQKIGIEEILIGAIALFLIFSDEKDTVLGVLLLALIFIE